MRLIPSGEFLEWSGGHQIAPDDRFAPPRCLVYVPHRPFDRFWEVPGRAAEVPSFVWCLLDCLERWSHCYLWPRDGWPHDGTRQQPSEQVYGSILDSAGIPATFDGAARYENYEQDRLIAAVFASLTFGWSCRDDLFVIPDHGRQFLQTDHHGVVHVQFAADAMVERFVAKMATKGYELPTELPDSTFKRPDWIA